MMNNNKQILGKVALGVGVSLVVKAAFEIGRIVGAVQLGYGLVKEMDNREPHKYKYVYRNKEKA